MVVSKFHQSYLVEVIAGHSIPNSKALELEDSVRTKKEKATGSSGTNQRRGHCIWELTLVNIYA